MICSACRSIWTCVSLLLIAGVTQRAFAQEAPLIVRPADREQISIEPRQVVATSFMVRNTTPASIEVELQIVLPANWRTLTPAHSLFDLPARGSNVRFASFMIPEDAKAGDYHVTCVVRDRRRPGIIDSYALQIRVLPAVRVTTMIVDAPDLAVSGDTIGGAIVFRNVGNAAASVKFTVASRHLSQVTPKDGELVLEAGETRRIELSMTAGHVRERATGRVTVRATVAQTGIADASSSMRIVPQPGVFESMRTVDSRFETRYVARDSPGGRTSGWQAAVSGGGVLDENRKDLLHFVLRGPDGRENGAFGASEEYWVRYESQHLMVGAGDLDYGLSPLTEPGRLGRGAQIGFHDARWGATAYGMKDAFGEGDSDQLGVGTYLRIAPETLVALSYLDRNTPERGGDILTFRTVASLDTNFGLDVEWGRSVGEGSHGGAYRFALRDDRHAVRYYALGWSADPDFIGPLRDKFYLSTGFDYPNPSGFGFRGYYRLQDWNLAAIETIDPDARYRESESDRMQSTPKEQQASVGTSHPLGAGTNLSLDLWIRDRDGSVTSARSTDLESASWRAGINRAWQNVSLFYSIEQGESRYKAANQRVAIATQMFSAALQVGRFQSYSLYWKRDDNGDQIERDPRRESAGLTASYAFGGFALNLDAQLNESRFGRGALYDLSMIYQRESGARFGLSTRRLEGRFARTDFLLSCSMPFAMPVMRRADVATVRGRVFDAATMAGVKGAVLRLDGITVATDARGEFRFPAARRGAHAFAIERGAADIEQVPATAMPAEVVIAGRNPPPLLIPMVRSATIEVRVTLKQDLEVERAAAGVLVQFRNGDTLIRRLTDAEGRAHIGGIPPGKWRVGVANDSWPVGYRPDIEAREFDVGAGETVSSDIVFSPEHREIRMQTPLAVR